MNAIIRNGEDRIPLLAVSKSTAKHPATVTRWCSQGVQIRDGGRVRLEFVRIGRTLMTSQEALTRFFEALSGHTVGVATETPAERLKTTEAANRELDALLKK